MTLHMLCGIPGSGKSTLVKKLVGKVVSTDALRKFFWGDESNINHDRLVFSVAEQAVGYMLNLGVKTYSL